MNRLTRPLDPKAVQSANAALAQQTGGRRLTMAPEDAILRRKWTEAYLSELSKDTEHNPAESSSPTNEAATASEYQDTIGADNDPGESCADCQNKPGSIKYSLFTRSMTLRF